MMVSKIKGFDIVLAWNNIQRKSSSKAI